MKNLKVKFNRIIDDLSIKYDFFYLFKRNKSFFFILFLCFFLIVLFIIFNIYKNDGYKGILENILPFFVDLFFVFMITFIILWIKGIYNDESLRINRSEEKNEEINFKRFLNIDIKNIILEIKKDFFNKSQILENLLKWINVNKDDYFRINYGSLDIPKITIKSVNFYGDKIKLLCGQASFFDITFTHYFPDYLLSSSTSRDSDDNGQTLRKFYDPIMEKYYKKNISNSSLELFKEFPNPMGITGIVNFVYKNQNFYVLQIRKNTNASSRGRVQWSFAGLIDVISKDFNIYENLHFLKFIKDELYDEIFDRNIFHKNKIYLSELKDKENKVKIIGFLLNKLYLYQPEFFVYVEYDLEQMNDKKSMKNLVDFLRKIDIKNVMQNTAYNYEFISVSNLKDIEKFIFTKKSSFKTRNMFKVGYEFLLHYIK